MNKHNKLVLFGLALVVAAIGMPQMFAYINLESAATRKQQKISVPGKIEAPVAPTESNRYENQLLEIKNGLDGDVGRVISRTPNKPCATKPAPDYWEGSGVCTGALWLHIDLPTLGFGLVYNSVVANTRLGLAGPAGSSWDFTFDLSVTPSGPNWVFHLPGGEEQLYIPDTSVANTWRAQDRTVRGKLVRINSSTLEFRAGENNTTRYQNLGSASNPVYKPTVSLAEGTTTYTITWHDSKRPASITDYYGVVSTFNYSGGRVSSISNARGGEYTFYYDSEVNTPAAKHNLESVFWPDERAYIIDYDGSYDLVTIFGTPEEPAFGIDYYTGGVVARVTPTSGASTRFSYDTDFVHVTQSLDTFYRENFHEGAVSSVEENNRRTVFTRYPAQNVNAQRIKTITNPIGEVTTYSYEESANTLGLVKEVTYHNPDTSGTWNTTYSYYPDGNVKRVIESRPNDNQLRVTTYNRDAEGRIQSIVPSVGASITVARNNGLITGLTSALGGTQLWAATFDGAGNLTGISDDITGRSATWQHQDRFNSQYNSASGDVVQIARDAYGAVTSVSSTLRGVESGFRQPTNMNYFEQQYLNGPLGELASTTTYEHDSPGHTRTRTQQTIEGGPEDTTLVAALPDVSVRANVNLSNIGESGAPFSTVKNSGDACSQSETCNNKGCNKSCENGDCPEDGGSCSDKQPPKGSSGSSSTSSSMYSSSSSQGIAPSPTL